MTTIIDSLKEFLTPRILASVQNYAGTEADKTSLIESLYPLIANQFTQKSAFERFSALDFGKFGFNFASDDEAEIYSAKNLKLDGEEHDVLMGKLFGDDTDPAAIKGVYDKLSEKFTLPVATVSALVTTTLPFVFNYLKSSAGDKPVYEYLDNQKEGLLAGIPTWLTAALPAGLLGASAINASNTAPTNPISTTGATTATGGAAAGTTLGASTSTTSTTVHKQEEKEGGFLKSLLPIIGLIILAGLAWLMLKSCQKQPTPVAAPVDKGSAVSAAALAPATLALSLNDKGDTLGTCQSTVGNAGLGEQLRAAVKGVFGADTCDAKVVEGTDNAMPAAQYVPQILGFMKGVPDASLNIADKKILLNSSDPTALEKLINDVKGSLPADGGFVVEADTSTPAQTSDTAPANLTPATLSFALDEKGEGLYACDGAVGEQGLGDKIRSAIASVFGADKADKCQVDIAKNTDSNLPIAEQMPQILGLMKGVPNASFNFDGQKILLNSSDPAALEKLINDVKGIVPAEFVVEAEPALNTEEAVKNAIDASSKAIDSLGEQANAEDLVKALNLQIINFASGKNAIPAENQAILDKAAKLMNKLTDVKLHIVGHTDNVGNADANQKLSESRAKAVRDYLVEKGVNADLLSVEGVRDLHPVATNATEQGRFKNRRIEFTLTQNGETVVDTNAQSGSDTASK